MPCALCHAFKQFLILKKNRYLFIDWLKDIGGANNKQANDCYMALREWCDRFGAAAAGDQNNNRASKPKRPRLQNKPETKASTCSGTALGVRKRSNIFCMVPCRLIKSTLNIAKIEQFLLNKKSIEQKSFKQLVKFPRSHLNNWSIPRIPRGPSPTLRASGLHPPRARVKIYYNPHP